MTSLVLPAYNPGPARLTRAWAALRQFLQTRPDWEALVVLDGCTDGSAECARRLARARPAANLRAEGYASNRGKGYAVRHGLLLARGERRVFTDIDLAYRFPDILRVDAALRAGADVAIASREHPQSLVKLPPAKLRYALGRRLQSKLFGTLARALLPVPFADTQAGLKGITGAAADELVPNLRCDGFGFDCELLAAAARYDLRVREVPVVVRLDDAASTTRLTTTARMAADLWRIRRRWPAVGFPPPASVPVVLRFPAAAPVGAAA